MNVKLLFGLVEKCAEKAASIPPRLVGKIDAPIAFIHMPKCGGTSIHSAISQHYRADHVTYLDPAASRQVAQSSDTAMLPFRHSLLAYELAKQRGPRFVSGHWPVDAEMVAIHLPDWNFVTVLRDPVERWLSNYFFNRHRADNRDHFGTELDLEAYLETSDAAENGKLYLSFCHGGDMPEGDLTAAIAQAIGVFGKFKLIGMLDDINGFLDEFEQRWQVRPSIDLSNTSPANKGARENALTPAILKRIKEICAPDREIYEAVRAQKAEN